MRISESNAKTIVPAEELSEMVSEGRRMSALKGRIEYGEMVNLVILRMDH